MTGEAETTVRDVRASTVNRRALAIRRIATELAGGLEITRS